MSREKFRVYQVVATINQETGEPEAPTQFYVELYRLDRYNTSVPLGFTWVEVPELHTELNDEAMMAVESALNSRSGSEDFEVLEDDPLKEIRDQRWNDITAIRDNLETSGFPYMGKWFDSDERSSARINTAALAAMAAKASGQEFSLKWTVADNTQVEMTIDDILGLPVAFAMYGNSLHETASALRKRIYEAETAQEIYECYWEGAEEPPSSAMSEPEVPETTDPADEETDSEEDTQEGGDE